MTLVAESDALHERVQRFSRGDASAGSFSDIALEIARFQARTQPGFARLIERRNAGLCTVADIPAVPVEAFRLTRVAVHAPELDEVRFETSGTTCDARGVHAMRTTRTYREVSLRFGRAALMAEPRATVVALAPDPGATVRSSLSFMMLAMMEDFDGRRLDGASGAFSARESGRWLLGEQGVCVSGLERAAAAARDRGERLLVLATSFALVALLDALGSARIAGSDRTVVMQTGGFKGKSREVAADVLRRDTARAFGISERQVIGEYGMTELTSQLYEANLPGAALSGASGVYMAPPWLEVTAVDPESLNPVPAGEVGLARFVDLGNVDSAVAIVTQDSIRARDGGIELLGRRARAPARGCSLAIEELLFSKART